MKSKRKLTVDVLRFLNLLDGPRLSLGVGGCVKANNTSSGMKSFWSDVGSGRLLSIALSLVLISGNITTK